MQLNFIKPTLKNVNELLADFRKIQQEQNELVIAYQMQNLLLSKDIQAISLKPRPAIKNSSPTLFISEKISTDPVFYIKLSDNYKNKLTGKIVNFLALIGKQTNEVKNYSAQTNSRRDFVNQTVDEKIAYLNSDWIDLYLVKLKLPLNSEMASLSEVFMDLMPAQLQECSVQICTAQHSVSIDKIRKLSELQIITLDNLALAQKIILGENLYNQWIIENDKVNLENAVKPNSAIALPSESKKI